jgi:hypothetical protein
MNQITLALEQPVYGIGQITCDLVHSPSACDCRDPGNLHRASGQLDKEQNQEAPQSPSGPNFHGKEIGRHDLPPVLGQKLLTRCIPNALQFRLMPLRFKMLAIVPRASS